MTSISRLRISNFRNLREVEIQASEGFNLVFGENGSGKSSFLEALSVLCHGKSFRTHKFRSLIHSEESAFTLFAKVDLNDGRRDVSLGMQRSLQGDFEIRLGGERIPSASILALNLPYIIIDSSSFALVEGGPKQRREFFDWLVFHVKHEFADHWRGIMRCYKQRNSLLKRPSLSYDEILPWDREIASASEALQNMRRELFDMFVVELKNTIQGLEDKGRFLNKVEILLKSGWRDERDYGQQLKDSFERDKRYGYSSLGPHKADLIFKRENRSLVDVFSRGQVKLFITALFISKARLVNKLTQKGIMFAIDDLPAELDLNNQKIFADWLSELGQQVFITAISPDFADSFFSDIASQELKVFHVKHGELELIQG